MNIVSYNLKMSKRGRSCSGGAKFRISFGLPVGAVINCANNTEAKKLFIFAVANIRGCLNRLPVASVGDVVLTSVKKGKPQLKKKIMTVVIIRQRKIFRRQNGTFVYFDDNAGVIINNRCEMIGSSIVGPVAKECANLWPRIASIASTVL